MHFVMLILSWRELVTHRMAFFCFFLMFIQPIQVLQANNNTESNRMTNVETMGRFHLNFTHSLEHTMKFSLCLLVNLGIMLLFQSIGTVGIGDLDKLNFFELGYGGSVLDSSHFLLLPKLLLKLMIVLQMVISDWKIMILLCQPKSVIIFIFYAKHCMPVQFCFTYKGWWNWPTKNGLFSSS